MTDILIAAIFTDNLALSFPEPFATVAGTAAMVGALWLDGLPPDTYATYATAVRAVTADDLARVAAAIAGGSGLRFEDNHPRQRYLAL